MMIQVIFCFISDCSGKNRMLADFYIPRLSNDIKFDVEKNHLRGQILYRSHFCIKFDPLNDFSTSNFISFESLGM